jgi:hypothetical protein
MSEPEIRQRLPQRTLLCLCSYYWLMSQWPLFQMLRSFQWILVTNLIDVIVMTVDTVTDHMYVEYEKQIGTNLNIDNV